nr:nuclear transport factor 2 family protein [Allomuricauda sp.]
MKKLISLFTLTICLTLNAQEMEQSLVQSTVTKLFVATDQEDWSLVEAKFADQVNLDYSSMTGNPAAEVSPAEITSSWKTVLPGFDHTHHQIGNFITEIIEDKAHVFVYGTASHFLEDENGSVWTVVGSYDFDLEKTGSNWKITAMTFNYKFQNGNNELIQKAIENVSKK